MLCTFLKYLDGEKQKFHSRHFNGQLGMRENSALPGTHTSEHLGDRLLTQLNLQTHTNFERSRIYAHT